MTKALWTLMLRHKRSILLLVSVSLLAVGFSQAGLGNVLTELSRFPAIVLASILLLFFLNISVVAYRLGRILRQFGLPLSPSVVSEANLQGHFAGLFLLSLFGQIAGRQWVLRHHQIPPVFIAALSGLERVVLLLVSGGMFVWGCLHLIGGAALSGVLEKAFAFEIIGTLILAGIATVTFGRSQLEQRLLSGFFSRQTLRNFGELTAITAVAQGLVLTTFMLGGHFIAPQADVDDLLAAAAITSFAASMPISVNGWGVRELAAAFAFGLLGASPSSAIALSVLIGLCSTAVIVVLYALNAIRKKNIRRDQKPLEQDPASFPAPQPMRTEHPLDRAGSLVLCLIIAILVFFQVHISLPSGILNINLADPFAMIALAALVMRAFAEKSLPPWRIKGINLFLALFSGLLFFAFVNGALRIGITQWALASRVTGWAILLGYFSVGTLAAKSLGTHGTRRVCETLFLTGALVVLSHMVVRTLGMRGVIPLDLIPSNFEGYAGNRNAFSFQMLTAVIMLIAVSAFSDKLPPLQPRLGIPVRSHVLSFILGCLTCGIAFSASRSGIITLSAVIVVALILRFISLRMILISAVYGAAVSALYLLSQQIGHDSDIVAAFSPKFSADNSDAARWASYGYALDLWLNNPIFGSGLGVFLHRSPEWLSAPLVIHSTPLWLLTEFGLIGFLPITAMFLVFFYQAFRHRHSPYLRGALLLLLAFATFSMVHEIFYQRIFWIALGVFLALPRTRLHPPSS